MWYRHEATLEVHGPFPIDMLRYDQCYPTGSGCANDINQSYDDTSELHYNEKYKVIVATVTQQKSEAIVWSRDRWKSFGVKIVVMRKQKA